MAWGREAQVPTFTPIFIIVAFKMWAYGPNNAKIADFGINFGPEGYTCFSDFYKIWRGEGSPRSPLSRQLSALWLLKCGLTPTNIAKNSNFWYKFSPKKKSRGSIEKLEYRCTTKNLPLCNSTIIVLKITLLYSVSVITNFVIPKHDRQTDR